MKIGTCNGFEIHLPTSGGKAGKGHAKTSTIQVRNGGFIVKQFKFKLDDTSSRLNAMRKAKAFMRGTTP